LEETTGWAIVDFWFISSQENFRPERTFFLLEMNENETEESPEPTDF
jgi:hypothetical protein